MKSICLVTAWNRPGFLQLCLEALSAARLPADCQLWVAIDRWPQSGSGTGQHECRAIAEAFGPAEIICYPQHTCIGNSYMLLETLSLAWRAEAERVFLVEDDVLVAGDFFQWHERVQEQTGCFASVAWKNIRRYGRRQRRGADCYLTEDDYSSIGVAWPRDSLSAILAHATPDYYRDLHGYLARRFPDSRFRQEGWEQDGLMIRVMGESGRPCAWSLPPRCWHIGWWGYHRNLYRGRGTLEQRIAFTRAAVLDGRFASEQVDAAPPSLAALLSGHSTTP